MTDINQPWTCSGIVFIHWCMMCVAQPAPNPRLSVVAGVGLGRLEVG